MHRLRPEGAADQAVSVLRGLRKPALLFGDHVQRSGQTLPLRSSVCSGPQLVFLTFLTGVCLTPPAECAPRPGHLQLRPGAVAVGASAGGDAGQHRGDDRGEGRSILINA